MLILSVGMHWGLLQSIAWTGMMMRYAHEGSVSEAVSRTFDGQHPCCLCKLIQKARAEEKKQNGQNIKPVYKMELAWFSPATLVILEGTRPPATGIIGAASSRTSSPPKPPPRSSEHLA